MKTRENNRLKPAIYESTRSRLTSHPLSSLPVEGCPCGADLSSAFGAPLLQGATQQSYKSAVYENTASLHHSLPRVGKVASIASRIGFQRDENAREQPSQACDLREYPIAAYLTSPFIPSRRRLPLRGRSILRLRRAPSSRGCSAVMQKRDIREYRFSAPQPSPRGKDGEHSEPDRVLGKRERMT